MKIARGEPRQAMYSVAQTATPSLSNSALLVLPNEAQVLGAADGQT